MRPPRLIFLLLCFIFVPIFLTTVSLFSSHSRASESSSSSGSRSPFKSLFSFHAPSSLFPPSAIISLTDDNSTFFLARPAAFGPLLPEDGLSGALWIGSGFGDDTLGKGGLVTGAEGELGCSDVPGWEDGDRSQRKKDFEDRHRGERLKTGSLLGNLEAGDVLHDTRDMSSMPNRRADGKYSSEADDGTDNHLHPLTKSGEGAARDGASSNLGSTHADIQSLQESAEIAGKVVLLSRGGCGFLEKVKWVQRRGGMALIVGDDTRGGGLVTMYAHGDTSNVTIPALFTSHTTAHLLSSLIPPENPAEGGASRSRPTGSNPNKHGSKNAQSAGQATPTKDSSMPTSRPLSEIDTTPGIFRSLLAHLGLSNKPVSRPPVTDSRRPPSSGNIDWVVRDPANVNKASTFSSSLNSNRKEKSSGSTRDSGAHQPPDDDFVIGVQDWRDPDLVQPPKNPDSISATSTLLQPGSKSTSTVKNQGSEDKQLKGGSITPGSGEYVGQDQQSKGKSSLTGAGGYHNAQNQPKQDRDKQGTHWWTYAFGWNDENEENNFRDTTGSKTGFEDTAAAKSTLATGKPANPQTKPAEHEGLWVTLTPTSMSTSPFFDTLLVLVVSPLVTLTVVYALLLLRSRIRRRRWRAPKAVVDRLPVRTYHTMSPRSRTPRTGTPSTSTPTSPLLSHSTSPRSRPRARTEVDLVNTTSSNPPSPDANGSSDSREKRKSSMMLSRQKYSGRQVECVVCLEEYIDGQSQIMSLPCGHEFHVQCITPWLTTRRRTCPICKGDVVHSLDRPRGSPPADNEEGPSDHDSQSHIAEARNDSPSSAIPIPDISEHIDSDVERGAVSREHLVGNPDHPSRQSNWRNVASLSLSTLSGDTMWHQSRHSQSDCSR